MTVAKVDRRTVANMTALQVHEKLVRALQSDRLTACASHDLDYAQDLMEALDEELAEYRGARQAISSAVKRTAAVVIGVFPTGTPGQVSYNVRDLGPEQLTRDEVIRILRSVAEHLEQEPMAEVEWRPA